MKRKLIDDLLAWKQNPRRKPLILKGIRQCGKTYLLNQFGKEHYDDVAYFNFEGNDTLQAHFERDLDVTRIISELGVLHRKAINPNSTLVIFDEIQFCNKALTSLKYFCENAPEYHIVCAGSLLGIALSKPLSFPVGKVDFLTLRPMNFYEFLLANNEEMLCNYLNEMHRNDKIAEVFSDKLEKYLKTYYITGGMPEAVSVWLATKDVSQLEIVQQRIIDSYELDFAKYAPSNEFPKLTAIWRSIPEQLAKENSKFIFSQVKQGLRAKALEDSLEWLISAGLAYKVMKIEKPFMPLSAYADQTFFKLYIADVGLFRLMSRLPASSILEQSDVFKEFKGALAENFVLCELIDINQNVPYYWKSGNTAEVDFVIQCESDIIPIEVKSNLSVRAKSLAQYKKKYVPRVSVITSMRQLSLRDTLEIPLYLLWKLKEFIKE